MSILIPNQSEQMTGKFISIDDLNGISPFRILTEAEWVEYDHWKAISRKRQWLTGRYLAKDLIREHSETDATGFEQIEILSRNDKGQSVQPSVRVNEMTKPWSLSISHTDTHAWAVLSLDPQTRIGIDLVADDVSRHGHLIKWFTDREKECLNGKPIQEIAEHWAKKEAIYKAINQGESFAPLKIEILTSSDGNDDIFVYGENITEICSIQKERFSNHSGILAEIRQR